MKPNTEKTCQGSKQLTFWELLPLNEHRHHSSFVSIELENTYFNTKGRECKLQSRNVPALVQPT